MFTQVLGLFDIIGFNVFMQWQDPNDFLDVTKAAVATGWGNEGDWVVCIPEQCSGWFDATVATLSAEPGSTSTWSESDEVAATNVAGRELFRLPPPRRSRSSVLGYRPLALPPAPPPSILLRAKCCGAFSAPHACGWPRE